MSFSELLKQCRKKQGISQAELASKLGVTQQAVGKWESGKSSPDPSTVARIAELLNTTADYLLGLYRPVSNVSAPEERFFGSYSESLIPVIGKQIGDTAEFGGLLGYAPVMPVNRFKCEDFISRTGRIPAPVHSFKN